MSSFESRKTDTVPLLIRKNILLIKCLELIHRSPPYALPHTRKFFSFVQALSRKHEQTTGANQPLNFLITPKSSAYKENLLIGKDRAVVATILYS